MYFTSILQIVLLINVKIVLSRDTSWDFFVFTQQWTPSVCISEAHEHKCTIPSSVKGWTIHGLWPNKDNSREDPHNCNETYKFNFDEIKSLLPNLTAQWPNVYSDTEQDSFWKHEWEKHGTCAMNLPATRNEFDYFSKTLQLNTKINLLGVLMQGGMIPSNDTGYDVSETEKMLEQYYHTKPTFNCFWDKDKQRQLFLEVELCLDKSFNPTKCVFAHHSLSQSEPCRTNEQFYFYPLPSHNEKYLKFHPKVIDIV